MADRLLHPPFDRQQLERIVDGMRETRWEDVSQTAEWLLRVNDNDRMTAEIRSVWQRSSLPLRRWVFVLQEVRAYTTDEEDCLWLSARLDLPGKSEVLLQAPFSPGALLTCGWAQRGPMPDIMRDLALHAPGLCFERVGMIGRPRVFLDPLTELRHVLESPDTCLWFCDEDRKFSLDSLLAEVASDCLGNEILLGKDGRLYFWNHELLTAIQRCTVSLEDLIMRFFEEPGCIMDDDFLGVVQV